MVELKGQNGEYHVHHGIVMVPSRRFEARYEGGNRPPVMTMRFKVSPSIV